MLELSGLRFGMIGLLCLAFLFLPVARGSVLLRLVDIPFEHATKYHVWLGHLTMLLFTLHGLFYVIAWAIQGRLQKEVSFHTLDSLHHMNMCALWKYNAYIYMTCLCFTEIEQICYLLHVLICTCSYGRGQIMVLLIFQELSAF